MSLKYCEECGSEWGGYSTHDQQHYCRGNVRVFRPIPTFQERENEASRMRDPWYANDTEKRAWYKRYRK